MLRSLWLLFIYLGFLGVGTAAPFVLALGYVWVDTFRPQEVAYVILDQIPVALIMGAAAFGSYILLDRRNPPRLTLTNLLQMMMCLWCTLTLAWAVSPPEAWVKWDWAFKTLVFAAFLPWVIRSRVQIEAFVQVYVLTLAANFIPFGVKTLISGGGYGRNLGLASGNSGLAEGGQLSTFCLMAVPIALYLAKHTQLIPRTWFTTLAYWGIAGLATVTALGTYERSALIGLAVLAIYIFIWSRHKLAMGTVIVIGVAIALYATSGLFMKRMETIGQFQTESSALTRLLVWRWTLDFAMSHPFGGSFSSYLVNVIQFPPDALNPGGYVQQGRAFHSIYFEVLGETGWPGLAMFLLTSVSAMLSLRRTAKRTRSIPHMAWVTDLANALQSGIAVFLTAGAFVGIAFQPMFWYFIAISISLGQYVRRVEALQSPVKLTGWRTAQQPPILAGPEPAPAGWRRR